MQPSSDCEPQLPSCQQPRREGARTHSLQHGVRVPLCRLLAEAAPPVLRTPAAQRHRPCQSCSTASRAHPNEEISHPSVPARERASCVCVLVDAIPLHRIPPFRRERGVRAADLHTAAALPLHRGSRHSASPPPGRVTRTTPHDDDTIRGRIPHGAISTDPGGTCWQVRRRRTTTYRGVAVARRAAHVQCWELCCRCGQPQPARSSPASLTSDATASSSGASLPTGGGVGR